MHARSPSLVAARTSIAKPGKSSWTGRYPLVSSQQPSSYNSFSTTPSRLDSASSNSRDAISSKVADVIPPPGATQVRKPKVDLHPAPLKNFSGSSSSSSTSRPPSNNNTSAAPTAAPKHPSKPPPSSGIKAPESASTSERKPYLRRPSPPRPPAPTLSIFKVTMEDLEDARKQGIMAPVPEGSGRWYKIWHQTKEVAKFYYRGSVALWKHRNMVGIIEQRARKEKAEGKEGFISWRESQFIRTYKQDRVKWVSPLFVFL